MSIGWRLCRACFADLSGEGARQFGGRWNSAGRRLVYLADHPALAVLEVRVRLDLPRGDVPLDYTLLKVRLPPGPQAAIDGSPADTRRAGDLWLAGAETPVLRVASALVPESWNLLLNPAHPGAGDAEIEARMRFGFDGRMWAAGA